VEISTIIVTYNSAECIVPCLESLLLQSGISSEIIVVDNDSKDNTLVRIKSLPCHAISSGANLGYGRGANLGFDSSRGRYLYLLNPDARILGDNSLAEIVKHMDANPHWGMASTRVVSPDGKTENAPSFGYPGQRHVQRDFSRLPGKIAWFMGASVIVRREVYEKLKGFDPGFFLYSEETDFCLRLREAGHEIGYIPEVTAEHIGGASEDNRDPYDVAAKKLKGLMRFRQKHYSPQDCVMLARRDLRRARLRTLWNSALAKIQPPRSKAWQKSRNYQAIWEVSEEYLAQSKANSGEPSI